MHIAQQPLKPFRAGPILEEADDFAATFALFHGRTGVVPLQRTTATLTAVSIISNEVRSSRDGAAWAPCSRTAVPCPAAASISLSGFGFLVSDMHFVRCATRLCPSQRLVCHVEGRSLRLPGRCAAWCEGAVRPRQAATAEAEAKHRKAGTVVSYAASSVAASSGGARRGPGQVPSAGHGEAARRAAGLQREGAVQMPRGCGQDASSGCADEACPNAAPTGVLR